MGVGGIFHGRNIYFLWGKVASQIDQTTAQSNYFLTIHYRNANPYGSHRLHTAQFQVEIYLEMKQNRILSLNFQILTEYLLIQRLCITQIHRRGILRINFWICFCLTQEIGFSSSCSMAEDRYLGQQICLKWRGNHHWVSEPQTYE